MKLDPDCVREVMLVLEKKTSIRYGTVNSDQSIRFSMSHVNCATLANYQALKDRFTIEEIAYTLVQLTEDGYIHMQYSTDPKSGYLNVGNVSYIAPKGHDLVASIHDKEVWTHRLTPIFKAIGNVSLSVIEAVSKGVASAAVDKIVATWPTDKS